MKRFSFLIAALISLQAHSLSFTERMIDANSFRYVDVADINQDGWQDIVAINSAGTSVTWYENDQDGTFTTHPLATLTGARSVKIIDFDEDENIDVVITSDAENSIYWYRNLGHESFTEIALSSSAGKANSLDVADVDNDNDLDLVVTTLEIDFMTGLSSTVSLYKNDGSENFPAMDTELLLNTSDEIANAIFANISSQTMNDIVIAHSSLNSIRRFTPPSPLTETTVLSNSAGGVSGLFAIDMDRDGDVDILSASKSDNTVRWHHNDSQSFTTHQVIHNAADGAIDVHAADIDFDGDMDIAAAAINGGSVFVYENNGSNLFTTMRLDGNTTTASSVHIADMNNDGAQDVVSASATGVRWHENDNPDIIFKSSFE